MNSTCPDLRRALRRLVLVGLAFGLGVGFAHAAPLQLDRIVAVVNDTVITEYELKERVEQTLAQLAKRNTPLPPRNLLARQLLERMIIEKAMLQLADDTNVRVDGATLDRAVNSIASQNGMDLAAFRAAVEKDGASFEDFRQQIRTEMIVTRLRQREVENRIVVTDAEIDNFLATQRQDPNVQTEYNLAHILILAPEGASPDQIQALRGKAEKALTELHGGADFAQVSAAYSDAQNALQGGDLGWRSEAKMPSLFVQAAKDLKVGDVSKVLRSANGFHILKLNDKRGSDATYIVRQTLARHILIKTNEVVTDQDAFVRLMELRDRLINGGADFERLARLNSGDLSASKGGDLGWLNPGDTVPEFERAMDALAPGSVSDPVRSPFGWHLIQVVDRRDKDVSQERRRLEARRAIRERKSEEAFEDWLRQVRDRAYVELRLEE